MASPSKCPHPACSFLFDPSQVPPGAVIACPLCGLRFTLAPMPPAYPGYPPAYAAPEPESGFQADLFASTEEPAAVAPTPREKNLPTRSKGPKPSPKDGALPAREKGKYGTLKSVAVAAVIVFALAAIPIGYLALKKFTKRSVEIDETATEMKFPDFNLHFKKPAPESGWTKHDATKSDFKAALFGYQRGDESAPTAWIVGDARKYGYAARPTDLRDRMMEQLESNFDNVTESDDAKDDTLCGLPATRHQFRATHKKSGDSAVLEVVTLANKTVGVWVFAWSPEREFTNNQTAFQSLRAALHISKENDSGIEVVGGTKTHRSKSGLFTLKDSDGLWTKKDSPTDVDPDGTLWLKGTPKASASKSRATVVDLVVAEVAPDGEAKDQALAIVKRSLPDAEPSIEELTGEPTGDPAAEELDPAAAVTRLKVRFKGADKSANKLVVFSTIDSGGKRIVAYAKCQLQELPYWEQRLMQIVGSLAPRTK